MELIRLEQITKTYHLGEVDVQVLNGVSLSIGRGEMVALMGASGSGKTTLMNILGCLDRPSSGQYWLDGQEMSRLGPDERALVRSAKLGFVFQSFNLLPRTDATHNVLMPLDYARHRPSRAEARRIARLLLDRVGLADRCDHEPSQMSGGQQQRVAIARALVGRPTLVLADEPTGNLDSQTSVEILRMFQRLNAEGITVILVTHDPKVAAYAHRTIRIVDGLIAGDEPDEYGGDAAPVAIESRGVDRCNSAPRIRLASRSSGFPISQRRRARTSHRAAAADSRWSWQRQRRWIIGERRCAAPLQQPICEAATLGNRAVARCGSCRGAAGGQPHGEPDRSWYGEIRAAAGATARPSADSHDAANGAGRLAGQQDAIRSDGVGRDHRRRGGHRDDGDRRGIEGGDPENDRQHGSEQPADSAGSGLERQRQLRQRHAIKRSSRADMDEILRQCPDVSDVAPIVWAHGQVVYGNRNWVPRNMNGTSPSYLAVRDWNDMEEGDMFTDGDVRNANKVCVIGTTIARELFGDESPVGRDVRIMNVPFRVVGVLEQQGGEHDGHGPGRHRAGALDDRQVAAQRQRGGQHHCGNAAAELAHGNQQPEQSLPGRARCFTTFLRPTRPTTRRAISVSSIST